MISLRSYQADAVNALLSHWSEGGGNALIEMATGTGKSLVLSEIARRVDEAGGRTLVVTHVKELIAQNFQTMVRLSPTIDAGIYSAGLNKRQTHSKVLFAGIQSVHRRAKELGHFDALIIDECHLVPASGEGRYLRFIEKLREINPDLVIGGLTATPYRLGEGRLDRGDGRIFEGTVYKYGIREAIHGGYLSPLISKAGKAAIDDSGVAKIGGDFKQSQIEQRALEITEQAVSEIVTTARADGRKAWLVFCAGVKHAERVTEELRRRGVNADIVVGDTPSNERASTIDAFKAGRLQALVSVGVLTTGFDAPNVDLVVMLRSTLSTSLYIQCVGRGTRLAPGKDDCLVLDFGKNAFRHGPVDAVVVREPGQGGSVDFDEDEDDDGKVQPDEVRGKECPQCEAIVRYEAAFCPHCDFKFPVEERGKHDATADAETPILSSERVKPTLLPVITWRARRHQRDDRTPTMRVDIDAGLGSYSEWIAFEHQGYARDKAIQWWIQHGGGQPWPDSVDDALERLGELTCPQAITVKPRGRYHDIVGRSFPTAGDRAA